MSKWKYAFAAGAIAAFAIVGTAASQSPSFVQARWHKDVLDAVKSIAKSAEDISKAVAPAVDADTSGAPYMAPTPIIFAHPHGVDVATGFISPKACHPIPIAGSVGPSCGPLVESYCRTMGHRRAAIVEFETVPQSNVKNRVVALVCTSAPNRNP